MNFKERCDVAERCLPEAGYRTQLNRLHNEMLKEIERLQNELKSWESAESHCSQRLSELLNSNTNEAAKAAREVAETFAQLCKDYATPTGIIYSSDIMSAMESYIDQHY